MEKMTKTQKYDAIIEVLTNAGADEELIELCNTEKAAIAAKAVKAQERAAQRKADGDALRATVQGLLTNEYQTADQITAAIGDEEITRAKVISRLSQLVKAEIAEKADAKTEEGKTIKVYKLA